jgi:hypothetical protein
MVEARVYANPVQMVHHFDFSSEEHTTMYPRETRRSELVPPGTKLRLRVEPLTVFVGRLASLTVAWRLTVNSLGIRLWAIWASSHPIRSQTVLSCDRPQPSPSLGDTDPTTPPTELRFNHSHLLNFDQGESTKIQLVYPLTRYLWAIGVVCNALFCF